MFASRGFRASALLLVLMTAFSLVAVDTAEARRGGSFGSRGTRTYQTAPATPTSPSITGPVQRTTAAPTTANRGGVAQTTAAQRAGWFGGGIGGWILGGLLFSGLFGMMFGAGFGGFGGFLALIVQVLVILFLLRLFFGRRQTATAGGPSGASPYTARQDWQPGGGGRTQRNANASRASQSAGQRDELGLTDRDLGQFEHKLGELQDAYAREDYEALRKITTNEMMGYLAEELGTNASKGLRNEVYDVKLLSGDISEAWREGSDEYATVALKYESRDVTRDRATGQIVSGADALTTTTELWTFVRTNGRAWRVSAIQEA
jgi:predicted lipid-binding transport protein (Tim44 family)